MKRPRRNMQKKAHGRFWSRPPFWFGVVIVFFAAVILAWGLYFEKQAKQISDASEFAPWDPSWPPLPALDLASHPIQLIRAAYAFAARRPDVVQYLPCYCGCEKQGHRSLEFCFVKKRTQKQTGIEQWDGMGFTCVTHADPHVVMFARRNKRRCRVSSSRTRRNTSS